MCRDRPRHQFRRSLRRERPLMRTLPHQTSLQVCAIALWAHTTIAGQVVEERSLRAAQPCSPHSLQYVGQLHNQQKRFINSLT